MAIDTKTPYGQTSIHDDVIAMLVANALLECYGVLGLAEKDLFKAGKDQKILKEEEFKKGIQITKHKDKYNINVYIACMYETKISEVVSQAQKQIRYVIEKSLGIKLESCNIYVQFLKEN